MPQAMKLTTDLVARIKSNGITAALVDPTPLDWKKWAPKIAARYKSEPARVLIDEMNAAGLRVTYVLRLWLMLIAYLSQHKG